MSTHWNNSSQWLQLPPVHLSLGSYGRLSHEAAIKQAVLSNPSCQLLGALSTRHLQLCPQNQGQVTEELAVRLRQEFPETQFRLHANVQVESKPRWVDWCDWQDAKDWFKQVSRISSSLGTSVYTAHAGRRGQASLAQVLDFVREAEQVMGMQVGIEGHYPTPNDHWLISSWAEYRSLLESGVSYALDLSHLHILACQSSCIEVKLVKEMLASPQCLEVHVSGNDGSGDQHRSLDSFNPPWWMSLLHHTHADAVVFSEGKQSVTAIEATAQATISATT